MSEDVENNATIKSEYHLNKFHKLRHSQPNEAKTHLFDSFKEAGKADGNFIIVDLMRTEESKYAATLLLLGKITSEILPIEIRLVDLITESNNNAKNVLQAACTAAYFTGLCQTIEENVVEMEVSRNVEKDLAIETGKRIASELQNTLAQGIVNSIERVNQP